MAKSAAEILDTLLSEWGASPAFEQDQIRQALKQLHQDIKAWLPEYRMPEPGLEPMVPKSIKDNYREHHNTGYNQALTDITKFLDNYFGGQE